MKKILMVAALAAMGAGAAQVVEITSVQQQYPWTNTVDITYTSTGIAEENTYYVVFKAYDAASKEIGVITNDLKVSQGSTWVAQWQPPFNVRYENCTMIPYVYKGGMDDYIIVDLATWVTTYEGMSTQDASNAKYNTPEYKTEKLVLRKIEPGEYTIGHANYTDNTAHKVVVREDKPYYIGIFPVTAAQYARIMGTSTSSTDIKPSLGVTWNTLRNSAGAGSTITGDRNNTANFFVRFNGLTGKTFDLPTEEMWEIAARAGTASVYSWGDDMDDSYCWHDVSSAQSVGTKNPNQWGIYDMSGNAWDWCLDVSDTANLASKTTDIYTPRTTGDASYRVERGGGCHNGVNLMPHSYRNRNTANSGWTIDGGFRLAYISE